MTGSARRQPADEATKAYAYGPAAPDPPHCRVWPSSPGPAPTPRHRSAGAGWAKPRRGKSDQREPPRRVASHLVAVRQNPRGGGISELPERQRGRRPPLPLPSPPSPSGNQLFDRTEVGSARIPQLFGNTSSMMLPKIELLLVSVIERVWKPSALNV